MHFAFNTILLLRNETLSLCHSDAFFHAKRRCVAKDIHQHGMRDILVVLENDQGAALR